jgi:hypothetical protein
MESTLIRMVWASIETCQKADLANLSNSSLIQHLLDRLHGEIFLSDRDQLSLSQYLSDRVMLVRDLLDLG